MKPKMDQVLSNLDTLIYRVPVTTLELSIIKYNERITNIEETVELLEFEMKEFKIISNS